MSRAARAGLGSAAALALVLAAASLHGGRQEPFPHPAHAGLFPLCTGCHEGVPAGDSARFYPEPALCVQCHDGVQYETVVWEPPAFAPTNLRFAHPAHARELAIADEVVLDCVVCHTPEDTTRMAVERAVASRCIDCHAHQATAHLIDAECAACHTTLAASDLPLQRILALPAPATHLRPDFLSDVHGELAVAGPARCSVCHTRETCTSCHVQPAVVAVIVDIPEAPPAMELPAYPAAYFVPASHQDPLWLERHGPAAHQRIEACATCHTRESCTTCHTERAPRTIARLASARDVVAPGVVVERRAPLSHAAPFFEREHGTLAATSGQTCTGCHTRRYCEECHNAPADPGYHPANFVARHASAAYGARLECSNCHDARVFCRDCHERTGMGTFGRLRPGFHDAQPLWLLRHGQPARQGLESCTTCHTQTDCMQCHSQLGAFRVSPHGPGFDPERAQARNAAICFACHLTDPTGRSNP